MPIGNDFRSSILRYFCPTKTSSFENFWWRHCMWFVVYASANQKSLVRLWIGDRLKNFFEDLFLNTCSCVLDLGLEHSCPWPRDGLSSERLSLASSLVSSTPPLLFITKWILLFIFCVFEILLIFYFAILFLINENKCYSLKISPDVIFRKKINIRPYLIFGKHSNRIYLSKIILQASRKTRQAAGDLVLDFKFLWSVIVSE